MDVGAPKSPLVLRWDQIQPTLELLLRQEGQ